MNITVIGIGKLGLGFSLLLEKYGNFVLGVDIFEDYINNLNNKTIEFHEDGYNNLLKNSKNFFATKDLQQGIEFSDTIYILVQTPNGGSSRYYDHTILSNLLVKISNLNYTNKNIIIGCTVMPGYINQVAKTLLPNCLISYNPEFVAQGNIIHGFQNSDIILVGTDTRENLQPVLQLIYKFCPHGTFCWMTPLEAEIVKISLNGFITTKISYANMISDLCDRLGANKNIVLGAIGTDSRIGTSYFKPGYSFGGPCFPRDTKALKQLLDDNGIQSGIIESTSKYNDFHIEFQTQQMIQSGTEPFIFENVCFKESKITIIEESAKLKIAKRLVMENKKVIIHDFPEIIQEVKKEFGNIFEYRTKNAVYNERQNAVYNERQNAVYNYWNSRPCNIKHSNKPIGSREYFMEVTQRKYFVESHILFFMQFEKYNGKNVLEIGCGIGTAAQTFSENRAIYTGIDISDYSIELSKKRFDCFNLSGNFFVHDIQIPFTNVNYINFDLVYSFGVLHHIEDIHTALKNIHSCLHPDGEFKLMLYAKDSYKYKQILEGKDQFEAESGVPIANVYTHQDVHELLNEYFMDICIWQTHIFPYKIKEYKEYCYIIDEPFASMSHEEFKQMESELGWHLCITCRPKKF